MLVLLARSETIGPAQEPRDSGALQLAGASQFS